MLLTIVSVTSLKLLEPVAAACCLLHDMEQGDDLAVGATFPRCLAYLEHMVSSNKGSVLAAFNDGVFVGCLVLDWGVIPYKNTLVAGGFYVAKSAPYKTAIYLMDAAAQTARSMRRNTIWLVAGTDKNKTRTTYTRLGFHDSGMKQGNYVLFKARLQNIEAALRPRMKMAEARVARWI